MLQRTLFSKHCNVTGLLPRCTETTMMSIVPNKRGSARVSFCIIFVLNQESNVSASVVNIKHKTS